MPGKHSAKPRLTRREKKAQVSSLVEKANSVHSDILHKFKEWTIFKKGGASLTIEYKTSNNLSKEESDQIFSLLKENMEELYVNSDWGWNEVKKQEELKDENSRFLLVRNSEQSIVGFSHFRFDVEGSHPVLYCYELQVTKEIQRQGLGRHLMNILFLIASEFKMTKIMLTVFNDNTAGLNFYMKSLAFRRDETCPYEEEEKCYIILCKFIDASEISNIKKHLHDH